LTESKNEIRFDPAKPLQVGGQAVIEGVMMRGPGLIATAVRRTDGSIVVRKREYRSLAERYSILKLPVIRGAVGLVEMMFVGIETLNFSAEVAMHDLKADEAAGSNGKEVKESKPISNVKLAITVGIALLAGIAIFFVTPLFVATKLFNVEQNALGFNLVAGGIRLFLLIGYLGLISLLKDVRRLFQYHGGEHKAVMTFESGGILVSEAAVRSSRFHPRCGTSFILIVMIAAVAMFALIDSALIFLFGSISLPVRLATHLPLVPLVGGLSYEFIRWSSKRTDTWFGKLLVAPGLWLQRITTRQPDDSQVECAIVALQKAMELEKQHGGELVIA
jgi:uncharacterized protein YqhQ